MKKEIMPERGPVMVFAEQEGGKLSEVALELCGKGRDLADALGAPLAAALQGRGEPARALTAVLIAQGCDEVHFADDARLEPFFVLPHAKVLCDTIRRVKPQIVLFGATPRGRELAPRVASELKTGLTADCTNLEIGGHDDPKTQKTHKQLLYQIRPAFGGNVIATIICPDNLPQMATVREGVMPLRAPQPNRKGRIVPAAVALQESSLVMELLERHQEPRKVNLKRARVIVAGGAGVGGADNFKMLRELAHLLGGELGASRSAVDSGLIGKEHQIGQTGTTVRPKLYIACGISGAVQHRAGMQESGKIIAINTDPEAPIFKIAHYGVVGDLNQVAPMLIRALRERQ